LALIFSSGGYETQTAYTAEQAIEIVAEWLPDLAIIDVVLPQTNGIDLAILPTAQYPACRIMIFSGQLVTVDLLAEAANKGYKFEILAKPTHPIGTKLRKPRHRRNSAWRKLSNRLWRRTIVIQVTPLAFPCRFALFDENGGRQAKQQTNRTTGYGMPR
jgi:CheY-like chemotaxis protein